MDFSPYKLIDYAESYKDQLIPFLDQGYKFVGYTSLELDTLDDDLTQIEKVYAYPSCFKLLLDEEKIIGSVAVKIKNKEAELKRVFIDPKLHGKGLGKKLSEWTFDYAAKHGCSIMHIWSGTLCKTAHALYQHLGAVDLNEQRFIGGQDDCSEYHFVKKLC